MNIQALVLMCHMTVSGYGCGMQYRNYDLIGWSNHKPKEVTAIVQAESRLKLEKDIGNAVQYLRTQFKIKHG